VHDRFKIDTVVGGHLGYTVKCSLTKVHTANKRPCMEVRGKNKEGRRERGWFFGGTREEKCAPFFQTEFGNSVAQGDTRKGESAAERREVGGWLGKGDQASRGQGDSPWFQKKKRSPAAGGHGKKKKERRGAKRHLSEKKKRTRYVHIQKKTQTKKRSFPKVWGEKKGTRGVREELRWWVGGVLPRGKSCRSSSSGVDHSTDLSEPREEGGRAPKKRVFEKRSPGVGKSKRVQKQHT